MSATQRMSAAEFRKMQEQGKMTISRKRKSKDDKAEWAKKFLLEELSTKRAGRKAKNGETFLINYDGVVVGLNEYKSLHWTKLKAQIDKVKERATELIKEKDLPFFECVEITVFHNTNYDTGNLAGTEKAFMDKFVELGYLKDDKKEYNPFTRFEYAEHLPKGAVVFQIRELKGVDN